MGVVDIVEVSKKHHEGSCFLLLLAVAYCSFNEVAAGPLMEDASEKDANLDVERQDVSTDDIDEDSDPECQEYDCSNEDEDYYDPMEYLCFLFGDKHFDCP